MVKIQLSEQKKNSLKRNIAKSFFFLLNKGYIFKNNNLRDRLLYPQIPVTALVMFCAGYVLCVLSVPNHPELKKKRKKEEALLDSVSLQKLANMSKFSSVCKLKIFKKEKFIHPIFFNLNNKNKNKKP